MNNKLKTVSVNPIIVKNYMGMIFESMIKGENVTAEPIDNSVNVGSLNVHYKIKDNQIITADNGTGFNGSTIEDAIEEARRVFIDREKVKVNVNKNKSNELAGVGFSQQSFQIGMFDKIGFRVNETGQYIIMDYRYNFGDMDKFGIHSTILPGTVTMDLFGKNPDMEIDLDFYEVTEEEFTKLHGLGSQYNGFFSIINLYKDITFKPNYEKIKYFTRRRYNELNTAITLEVEENYGKTGDLYYPIRGDKLVRSFRDMRPAINPKTGKNEHIIRTKKGREYHIEIFSGEAFRKSETHLLADLIHKIDGEENLYSWDSGTFDKTDVDIYATNLTRLFGTTLFPKKTMWPPEFNNIKWGVRILSTSPNNPSAKDKSTTGDQEFLRVLRQYLKQVLKVMNWESSTKSAVSKKEETNEINNWLDILKDEEHTQHAFTVMNAQKLLGTDINDITNPLKWDVDVRKVYVHDLDIVHNDNILVEWQVNMMDDEHYTELHVRLFMDTKLGTKPSPQLKRVMWVHGKESKNTLLKLENTIEQDGAYIYSSKGIEQIIVMDKKYLFQNGGWKFAKVYDLKKLSENVK